MKKRRRKKLKNTFLVVEVVVPFDDHFRCWCWMLLVVEVLALTLPKHFHDVVHLFFVGQVVIDVPVVLIFVPDLPGSHRLIK